MGKKIFKKLAFSGLAVCIGALALLGCACTPATSATQGTHGASSGTDGGASRPAGTNTSPFGLNPETDPTVYTTSTGLEIKYANELSNSNLAGYTYFTMGEYDGTPVNWVIIGYDPSVSNLVGEYTGDFNQGGLIQGGHNVNSTLDNSPMGNAIRKEFFAISNQAVENDEIGDCCVLCLSECVLCTSQFASNNIYEGSILQERMHELYENNLNLSVAEKQYVKKQSFSTNYLSTSCTSEDQDFFSLAGRSEKFNCISYLTSANLRYTTLIATNNLNTYWLRSGYTSNSYVYHVGDTTDAVVGYGGKPSLAMGVRPAFVMKLM